MIPGFTPIRAPLVCDELKFEGLGPDEEFELETFAPLLTGKREDVKSTVGSLDTVVHVPLELVVLGLYANDLTTPSLPSMTIELVLAAKLAPRSTTGGGARILVVLEMTLTT